MKIFDFLVIWVEQDAIWAAQESLISKFLDTVGAVALLRSFDFGIKAQMTSTDKILTKKVLRSISDRDPEKYSEKVA